MGPRDPVSAGKLGHKSRRRERGTFPGQRSKGQGQRRGGVSADARKGKNGRESGSPWPALCRDMPSPPRAPPEG